MGLYDLVYMEDDSVLKGVPEEYRPLDVSFWQTKDLLSGMEIFRVTDVSTDRDEYKLERRVPPAIEVTSEGTKYVHDFLDEDTISHWQETRVSGPVEITYLTEEGEDLVVSYTFTADFNNGRTKGFILKDRTERPDIHVI